MSSVKVALSASAFKHNALTKVKNKPTVDTKSKATAKSKDKNPKKKKKKPANRDNTKKTEHNIKRSKITEAHSKKSRPKQPSVLSLYGSKRRNKGKFDLMERLRDLLPGDGSEHRTEESKRSQKINNNKGLTAEELEDQEAELRRIKSAEGVTFSVYKSPTTSKSSTSMFEPRERSPESPTQADGYSASVYIRQLVTTLRDSPDVEPSKTKILVPVDSRLSTRSNLRRPFPPGKREFDPRYLGWDEEEFYNTKFKHIVKGYIPEGSHHQIRSPPRKNVGMKLRKKRCSCATEWCCSWYALSSCGTCNCLKMYVVATLLCSILMLLMDPCYLGSVSLIHKNGTFPYNDSINSWGDLVTTGKPGLGSSFWDHSLGGSETIPNRTKHSPQIRILMSKQRLYYEDGPWTLDRTLNRKNSQVNFYLRSGIFYISNTNYSTNTSYSNSTSKPSASEPLYCGFKTYYLVWMVLGVFCFTAIFLIYTCQLIMQYYNFPWFLLEAWLLSFYSTILLLNTIAAYIFIADKAWTVLMATLMLVSSIFCLLIAYWNYANYASGVTPLLSITTADPDMNEIAQILGRKQFYKWFVFGKDNKDEGGGGSSTNDFSEISLISPK